MPSKKNKLESRFKPKEKLAEKVTEKVTEKITEKVPVLEIPQVEETLIDTIVEETPVCETQQTIDDCKTIPIRSDQIICNGELLTINVKELVNFFKSLACGKVRYGRSPHGAAVHLGLILEISKDEARTFMANFKTK